jgi:hypothetical protein
MKSILMVLIILSFAGCALNEPISKSPRSQIKYQWSQIEKDLTKKDVTRILGDPTDINYSEDVESWKYEYEGTRSYGTVSFRSYDNFVWFYSKPSF